MDSETTETTGTEVTEAPTTAVASGRLGRLMSTKAAGPAKVMDLITTALGEDTDSIQDDAFFGKTKDMLEKVGLLHEYLVSQGIESVANIDQWRPVLVGINSGKGNSAKDLRHLDLNTLYNYNSKEAIDLAQKFYPIFIHGEEILKDDSGMNVEDRITVTYNSKQEAHTPGYDYQNIVYLLNDDCNEVYKITVKSAGHKFVTNILRSYMYSNYKKGMMFNTDALNKWMTMESVNYTSKSGFTNPYAKLTASDKVITSDEVKLITILQRLQYDTFQAVIAKNDAVAEEAQETQDLVDSNTTTDDAGDNFTQL